MRKASVLLWLAALAVVAIQAMALATRYFQPWLDGDYLLPERFAADCLHGNHPLSGWTLSSSPYLFPDLTLSVLWRAVLGAAPLLPYYVVAAYVALALVAGWSLRRARSGAGHPWIASGRDSFRSPCPHVEADLGPPLRAQQAAPLQCRVLFGNMRHYLAGALLVNILLFWQEFADHARWLWWLGVPTFHGGAVLLGLAQFALWAGPPAEAPSRRRMVAAGLLAFAGLFSDTLLFTQFVAPLGVALYLTSVPPRLQAARLRAFLLVFLPAGLAVVALRVFLQVAQWGNYPAVVRYLPTPEAVGATAGRMWTDVTGPVAVAVPGFIALGLGAFVGAVWFARRRSRPGEDRPPEQRQAAWFAGLCLLSTLLLPVLTVYWRNPQHGRHLLPCLVVPLWWLATSLPPLRPRGPAAAGLLAASLLGLAGWQLPKIDFAAWAWPHPGRVAELERLLGDERATRGLADFWTANYLNATSRTGLRLNQIRPDGRVQFWGNNAFHHFEADSPEGPLRTPRYSFIVVDGLDAGAVRGKFGPPARQVMAGGYEVWLYDEPGAQRISALVDAEVRAFLGSRPGTQRIAR